MEKNYTKDQYFEMAAIANEQGKVLETQQETVEYTVEVLEWHKKTIEVPVIDPETGEPTGQTERIQVDDYDNPIMIDEQIINPETGETITVHVQKHHPETRTKIVENLVLVDQADISGKLKAQLEALDKKSIRSLRAIAANSATTADREYLANLEEQAEEIRSQLG